MPATPAKKQQPKEIAFYYPGPIWHGSEWIPGKIDAFGLRGEGLGESSRLAVFGRPEEDLSVANPLLLKAGHVRDAQPRVAHDEDQCEDLELQRRAAPEGSENSGRESRQ